jgi:hypothetical protein
VTSDSLATIRTHLLERATASQNDPLFETSIIDRIINAANRRLGRVTDWPWLKEIGTFTWTGSDSNGQDLSATITNFRHLNYLATGDQKLQFENPQAFVALNALTSSAPRYYTILKDTLFVSPNPATDTTLSYYCTIDENELLDDDSAPLLPVAYTELLVLQALQPLAVRMRDSELLGMAKTEYRTALDEARDEVRRTRQLPSVEVDRSLWSFL